MEIWHDGEGTPTGKFENLSSEVLQDCGGVDSGLRAYADIVLCALLEVSVNTAHGELWRTRGSQLSEGLN